MKISKNDTDINRMITKMRTTFIMSMLFAVLLMFLGYYTGRQSKIVGILSSNYQIKTAFKIEAENRAKDVFENQKLPKDKATVNAVEFIIFGDHQNRFFGINEFNK